MGGRTFLPAPPERCWQEAESLLRLVPGEKELLGGCTGGEGRILPPSHVLKHPCGPSGSSPPAEPLPGGSITVALLGSGLWGDPDSNAKTRPMGTRGTASTGTGPSSAPAALQVLGLAQGRRTC